MTLFSIPPLIAPSELAARLDDPALAVFDVSVDLPSPRFDGDYRVLSGLDGWRKAHIPGTRHLDLVHDFSDDAAAFSFALPPLDALARRFAAAGIGPQATPVLYDRGDGFWAARLWWMLRSVGQPARVLDGGYRHWVAADLPCSDAETPPLPPSSFPPAVRPALWADRDRVHRIINGDEPGTLLCALSQSVFDGTAPTRYSRRGHIPGSLNLPARAVFDADGFYLPVPAQRAAWAPILASATRPLVLYCGGGISAASLALSLVLIGEEEGAIYDGSLQEWSADPTLPLSLSPG